MFAAMTAGDGGTVPCRFMPAALVPRPDRTVYASTAAAAGAALLALLLCGLAMPPVEWLALPERVAEMKHRPREFGPHFVAVLLALCGLDLINDLAAVLRTPAGRRAGRALYVAGVKALMLFALVGFAAALWLSDRHLSGQSTANLFFLGSDYAGQWAELAVGMIGNVLLLSATFATPAGLPAVAEQCAAGNDKCGGGEQGEQQGAVEPEHESVEAARE